MDILQSARGILVGLFVAASVPQAGAEEFVVNGDFARGGDPPSGWVREPVTAGKGALSTVNGVLELAPNSTNTTSDRPLGIGQAIDASSMAGKTLVVSARLGLLGAATGAVVGLHALRSDGSEIAMVHLRRAEAGEGLETKSATLTIPPQEKPKLLILFAVAEGTGGVARFSAVSVTAASSGAPVTTAQPIGEAAAYQAKATVNAVARGRVIPRSLYGVNIEWWRNANGLWDERSDRLDPDLVRLTKELQPSLIRFPGGFLGDAYNWQDATGPRKSRPSVAASPVMGEKMVPNFGSGELLDFAGSVGADLLLSANLGTGTAGSAANWVGYMKDAHARNPTGPRVQYWEMGNELYHKGDASGVSLTPEAYAEKLGVFARQMRAVDGSIRIGAIGMENYPTFPFNSYRDWNEIVLKRTGAEIDFFAVHDAYAPAGVDDRADPRDVYRALWAAPLMVEENLRTVSDQIRRFTPHERSDQIRIAVTEWAPLFHILASSPWIDHSKTLGSAVYVADILRVLMENDRVDVATFFKLNEPSFLGLVGVRHGQWNPNATYYAFELFTRHFGSTLVSSSVVSPSYDSVRAGIVPAMKHVPVLTSVASVSADGSRLFVMLINKSIDQPADVTLDITGFEPASGFAHILTGASADSNTGSELPKVPGLTWAKQANVSDKSSDLDRGDPNQISYSSKPLGRVSKSFVYRVPAHSVVCLELGPK